MMNKFVDHCKAIDALFTVLSLTDGRNAKLALINNFRNNRSDLVDDLNFCFEVLAGKHKLGYTYGSGVTVDLSKEEDYKVIQNEVLKMSIQEFIEMLKDFGTTQLHIESAYYSTPYECRSFIENLINRLYKLGYSNQEQMRTNLSPMLAKKYPESHHEDFYYIQEKLDGNRCIAYYDIDSETWKFQSRSGKPLNVKFNMDWADKQHIFDGEIMTLGHAGSRDFNRTSGVINSKYLDKSSLHYYIYDIIDDNLKYKERKQILDTYSVCDISPDCSILPVLDEIHIYVNPEYNWRLDEWLDKITAKGGEGLILRDPEATYKHTRTDALLKYKKVQTMDLRIVGWNEGKGKYTGCIGSFICETDDQSIRVNVAGMSDSVRFSNPINWIGKIIEVAYFDNSTSKTKTVSSLRFPRMKRVRDDKNTTSIY